MRSDIEEIQNMQYKLAITREKYTKSIEKLLKKKNELELKKLSNVEFQVWSDYDINVPELKKPEILQIPSIEKHKMDCLKSDVLNQIKLMKIIQKRGASKIAKLVDQL